MARLSGWPHFMTLPGCWISTVLAVQIPSLASRKEWRILNWLVVNMFYFQPYKYFCRYLKWDMKSWSPKTFQSRVQGDQGDIDEVTEWYRVHQIWAGRSPPSIASYHCGASGLAAGGGNDPVGHPQWDTKTTGFYHGVLPCSDLREYV